MGRPGLWIPAAEKVRARAVKNMVAAAEVTASLEPIAVARSVDPAALPVEPVAVARSEDPEAPLMVPNVVVRSADPEAHPAVSIVVARSVHPEAHLVEQVVVARSVDPVVPLAGDAAVEVVRILSIIFSRRLRPPFFYDLG